MERRTPSPSSLLFSSVIFLTLTAGSYAIPKATDFIRASCRATLYPSLCLHSLSAYATEIRQSERRIALVALAVSLARARSAAMFVSGFSRAKGIKHREFEAVKDCVENMGDSVGELSESVRELGHTGGAGGQNFMWHMSNVQTWVSAALTDQQTCVDGFGETAMDGSVKDAVSVRVISVARVTSNALALVNLFASGRHRVGENGD
ncbi:hypothetical protein Nepgr_011345 [Nepenthes gracilis]|uniref:Pectinesterase inhibitor domain-containing protein n=1 Tax=Nepenthes gracilis TaxID=150966 RepID=A0AAD3SES1_NEPGR|nr:hypothetical protein Nepgr_011345 [Nepenthes gracilis]